MCEKCETIDENIARYKRIRAQVMDERLHRAVAELLAELESKKAALHPE